MKRRHIFDTFRYIFDTFRYMCRNVSQNVSKMYRNVSECIEMYLASLLDAGLMPACSSLLPTSLLGVEPGSIAPWKTKARTVQKTNDRFKSTSNKQSKQNLHFGLGKVMTRVP